MQDKIPHNKQLQRHGYWEQYWNNGKIWKKGNYINDNKIGHWIEYHYKFLTLNKQVYYAR